MRPAFRYSLAIVAMLMAVGTTSAQVAKWREVHKVKSKETIFGLARENGISIQELIEANPEMADPGYELKKGTYIFIPYPKDSTATTATVTVESTLTNANATPTEMPAPVADDLRSRAIRLGVMLPFNANTTDGMRMVEYYRGVLMACDSLRKDGTSVDVYAWNTTQGADLSKILNDTNAGRCDLIIGPYYSKHVKQLANFAQQRGIKVLVPFATNTDELQTNASLFLANSGQTDFEEVVIERFLQKFSDSHPVFIDCNDAESRKGSFTMGLRKRLEAMGRKYSITNLTSPENNFANAFSKEQPNVVILNSGNAPQLNIALAKINSFSVLNPEVTVTLFGYPEWLGYTQSNLDDFYKYSVYIPSASYANPLSEKTSRMEQKYQANFRKPMSRTQPQNALSGFDHTYFFVKGLHTVGASFTGAAGSVSYDAIQSPLHFVRVGNGGYKNVNLFFVHYTPEHKIETINF